MIVFVDALVDVVAFVFADAFVLLFVDVTCVHVLSRFLVPCGFNIGYVI